MASVAVSPVRTACGKLQVDCVDQIWVPRQEQCKLMTTRGVPEVVDQVHELALFFEKERNKETVLALREEMMKLSALEHELRSQQKAIKSVSEQYEAPAPMDAPTDFAAILTQRKQEIMEADPLDAENHKNVKKFDEAVWEVNNAGLPMPGTEDEEVMCATATVSANTKCPITSVPVFELENPVKSKLCGHVYDGNCIEEYINGQIRHQRHGARSRATDVQCPQHGCSRLINKSVIEEADDILAEAARLRRQRPTGNANRQHVEDITQDVEDVE
eukprot:jgi/Chlat1/4828/Chrsp31S04804